MCGLCVDIAKKEFARWSSEQQRTARLAILSGGQNDYSLTARGDAARYARGREVQRGMDAENYDRVITPKVLSIRAAVAQAEEQIVEGKDPAEILRTLLANVRTDCGGIPRTLP